MGQGGSESTNGRMGVEKGGPSRYKASYQEVNNVRRAGHISTSR